MANRNLANWLQAYMELTRETESADQFHFWVGASIISAITKRQVFIDMGLFKVYPNMYIMLVGPSGARKSIATDIGVVIADKAGIKRFSNKITDAAIIKSLADYKEQRVEAVSGAGHATIVELCSPMMVYASELGVFMGTDAYSSGVIADLTDLYDCPLKFEKKTISRGEEVVHNPFVTLLAATTPQTLKDVIPTGAVGQGFTSRVLFVWAPKRRKRVPFPAWDSGFEMLKQNLLADLAQIGRLKGVFSFSKDGRGAFQHHYMTHAEPEEEFEDERFRGYGARRDTHLLKLAQIMSLAERDDLTITEKEIAGALDAIKWLDAGLPNVFAGHGDAASAEDVVRVFKQIETATRTRLGFVTHAELLKRNYYHLNSVEFGLVITTLLEAEAIDLTVGKDPKSNKHTKIYRAVDPNFIQRVRAGVPKRYASD